MYDQLAFLGIKPRLNPNKEYIQSEVVLAADPISECITEKESAHRSIRLNQTVETLDKEVKYRQLTGPSSYSVKSKNP